MSYTPRLGSLPDKVLKFLNGNPEEHLTIDDIALKFDGHRNSVHSNLAQLVQEGLIARQADDEHGYIYTSPTAARAATANAVNPHSATPAKAAKASAAGAKQPKPTLAKPLNAPTEFDPLALKLDDTVPLPPPRGDMGKRCLTLLKRMQVKQSVALPAAAKTTLTKQITVLHKAYPMRFAVRPESPTEIRVWRTA